MSHECPDCGQQCYCDGEDHGQQAPDDCCHECDPADVAELDAMLDEGEK